MINRHIEIELDDARDGMTLSQPILDGKGFALLPAGTALTESVIKSLQRRGIDAVFIVNDTVSESDLRLERERVEKRLAVLFRKCAPDGVSQALRKSVLAYRSGEPE